MAITGLFLRPKIDRLVNVSVKICFAVALFLIGMHLISGLEVMWGFIVGLSVVFAQIATVILFMRAMSVRDRAYLACSQQNGITAIILALLFETQNVAVAGIVAFAILVINLVHTLSFHSLDYFFLEGSLNPVGMLTPTRASKTTGIDGVSVETLALSSTRPRRRFERFNNVFGRSTDSKPMQACLQHQALVRAAGYRSPARHEQREMLIDGALEETAILRIAGVARPDPSESGRAERLQRHEDDGRRDRR